MSFLLEIVTPEKKLFSGQVSKLSVPSVTGEITILSHHLPLFTMLQAGQAKLTEPGQKQRKIPMSKGLLEVQKTKSILLLEPALKPGQIEQETAKAKAKSQQYRQQKITPQGQIRSHDAFRRSFIDFKDIKRRKRSFVPNPEALISSPDKLP
jgi:F-type H+-transporting ATPase subunit epsilon